MNQDDIINASYCWTVDELLLAHSLHAKFKARRKILGLVNTRFSLGLLCILSMALVLRGIDISHPISINHRVLYGLLLWSLLSLGTPWLREKTIRQHFNSRPDQNEVVAITIDKQTVTSKIDGVAEASNPWETFTKVIQTPKGFLLYPNRKLFYWIPYHAFASTQDIDQFTSMAYQYSSRCWSFTRTSARKKRPQRRTERLRP